VTEVCTVVAIFTPKPEFSSEIKNLLSRVSPLVHNETGCQFYTLNQDVEGRLIFIEAWATRQDWIDHMEQPTVKEILAGVEGKLQSDVEVYELYNVPTGTSGKGSLAQASPATN
jgi:quinol monooxygenase YgiN